MAELIAERYAQAAFDIGIEQDRIQQIQRDAGVVRSVLAENPDLKRFLSMPTVSAEQKYNAMAKIFEGEIEEPVAGLLHVLIRAGRTEHLSEVLEVLEGMILDYQKQVRGEIASAYALSQTELDRIQDTLSRATGKTVILEPKVDPSLIGGVVVRVNDVVYDNSIKSQLAQMTRHLRGLRIVDS